MKTFKKTFYIGLAGMMLSLSACSSSTDEPDTTEPKERTKQDWVTINTTNEEWAKNITKYWSAEETVELYAPGHKAIFDFSERLTDEIGKAAGNDGFVVSPFSVVAQLAIVANSADETGRQALLDALSVESIEGLNKYCRFFIVKYTQDFKDRLAILNNHLWVSQDCNPGKDYVEKIGDLFNVGVEKVDFSSSQTAGSINDWMYSFSKESIANFVDEDYLKDKTHVMANALVMDASIPVLRDTPSQIQSGIFHAPDGDVEVDMVKGLRYTAAFGAENDIAEKMEIFVNAGFSVSIYMPKGDVKPEDLTRVIDADVRRDLDKSAKQVGWTLNMPLVDFSSKTDVTPYLSNIGFDFLKDISLSEAGIATPGTDVLNQTHFKLGEGRQGSNREVKYDSKTFNVNKPFIFSVGLRASTLDLCIVSGVVANPAK